MKQGHRLPVPHAAIYGVEVKFGRDKLPRERQFRVDGKLMTIQQISELSPDTPIELIRSRLYKSGRYDNTLADITRPKKAITESGAAVKFAVGKDFFRKRSQRNRILWEERQARIAKAKEGHKPL